MYFNQLAREVDIGQQVVFRYLQALEESGLVETYEEKSDLGAPDRKCFTFCRRLYGDSPMTESRHDGSRV